MQGRKPNKEEQQWLDAIRPIGCICCIELGLIEPYRTPEEYTAIHHIDGCQKPGAHLKSIPICDSDHQHAPWARHVNKRLFVQKFGTEQYLLEQTRKLVDERDNYIPPLLAPNR